MKCKHAATCTARMTPSLRRCNGTVADWKVASEVSRPCIGPCSSFAWPSSSLAYSEYGVHDVTLIFDLASEASSNRPAKWIGR